jgi:MoaA/NifB/PqqE/SkfB family radical SAM enzyme
MASRYLAYRFRELHPFEAEANVTNACNLRCSYCRCTEIAATPMTTDQWREIIRRLAALGTIRFKFHGGEPTLRPDFRELSAEVQQAGMVAAAVTNGSTIPSRPELLDYLDELCISLDSPDSETNDHIRGEGSYQRAVQTIDLSLQRGVRTVVNMVLTRKNLSDLEEMLEFCEARGVLMNAQPVVFGRGRFGEESSGMSLSSEEIRAAHLRLANWKRQGCGLVFSAWAYQKVADWTDYTIISRASEGKSSCVAGRYFIYIEPNGEVIPCCLYEADFTPKNIIQDGLDEALRHVRTHNCGDCWRVFYHERRAVFRLRPEALQEVLRRG